MLNYAEFLSSAEFGNSAEFRNSSEFTNSPKFRISGLQKFGRIRDIDWITRNSFLRWITRNGFAFLFRFPLFPILFAACFLQNTLRFFLEGYVLFFAVFLRLTVHIVVFEGSLPFGPTIGHGDGLRGNLHGYRRRRGDGFSLVGKKQAPFYWEKRFRVPAKRRTGSFPKKAIFSKRRELFRRK